MVGGPHAANVIFQHSCQEIPAQIVTQAARLLLNMLAQPLASVRET
jgi:hypothetical protein